MVAQFFTATHSVPVFEGRASRSHERVPLWRLALRGAAGTVRRRGQFDALEGFVQFIGFPRSGHSLIGALLNAHADAVIAHELDTMGLLRQGFSANLIYALIVGNAAEFHRHGQYWNGFSYAVPGHDREPPQRPRVIGDKKGDWAVRWFQAEPELIEIARQRIRARCQWILVTRHPLDNIATMSLRKNGAYDKLRIACGSAEAFRTQLKAAQERHEVTPVALDSMIDDYEQLCAAVEAMLARIPPEDRMHVVYERFVQDPAAGLGALYGFANLVPDEACVTAGASIVRNSPNKSRTGVSWSPAQLERVRAMTHRYAFLEPYVGEAADAS